MESFKMGQNHRWCKVLIAILALCSTICFLAVYFTITGEQSTKQQIDQVSVNRTLTVTINDMTWHEILEEPSSEHFRQTAHNILLKLTSLIHTNHSDVQVKKILLIDMWNDDDKVSVDVAIIFEADRNYSEDIFDEFLEELRYSQKQTEENEVMIRHRRQVAEEYTCGIHKKMCEDGTCIFRSWWCNGQPECPDGSDEDNCQEFTSPRPTEETSQSTGGTTLSQPRLTSGASLSQPKPTGETSSSPPIDEPRSTMPTYETTSAMSEYESRSSMSGYESTSPMSEYESNSPMYESTSPDSVAEYTSTPFKNSTVTVDDYSETTRGDNLSTTAVSFGITGNSTYVERTNKTSKTYVAFDVIDDDEGSDPMYVSTTDSAVSEFSCRDDAFQCDNMACVPRKWVCDNITDCSDWSDESESACNLPPVMNHPDITELRMWKVTKYAGIPAVKYKGKWGGICDDYWDENDADVFCRSFLTKVPVKGYPRYRSWYSLKSGTVKPLLDAVDCNGRESNFSFCAGPPLGRADCSEEEIAGVVCQPYIDDIRLVGRNDTYQGRVEISVNGSWATICDNHGWDQKAAQVVCRMLNLSGPAYNVTSSVFGNPDSVELIVGRINCTGNESSILECWSGNSGKGVVGSGVTKSRCSTRRAAGVSCGAPVCLSNEVACADKKACIPRTSVCNGLWDCTGGTDETNCTARSRCLETQFTCGNPVATTFRRCIASDKRCDGILDCPYGSDERNCVLERKGDKAIVVIHNGSMTPLCISRDYQDELAQSVCVALGARGVIDVQPTNITEVGMDVIKSNGNSSLHGFSIQSSRNCTTFTVNCFDDGCGTRGPRFAEPFILAGEQAQPGEWRWQARLTRSSNFVCGAVIISPRYLLTAAHCVRTGRIHEVVVGDFKKSVIEQTQVIHRVKQFYRHPLYREETFFQEYPENDIALLKLEEPIEFNRYTGPPCLPSLDLSLRDFRLCYATGWGRNVAGILPDSLQETPVRVYNHTECRDRYSASALSHMVCPYKTTRNWYSPSGKGDSGGPLVCLANNNRWILIGLSSYREHGDYRSSGNFAVYTKVASFLDWIRGKFDCFMWCDFDTKCIHREQICDNVFDCHDKKDEECGVNCTFQGHLCGYDVLGWKETERNKICAEGHVTCDDMKYCIREGLICDGIRHCQDGSDEKSCSFSVSVNCTFEDTNCGYQQSASLNVHQWITRSINYNPNNLKQLVTVGDSMVPLRSPVFEANEESCYTFYYQLPDTIDALLNVFIERFLKNGVIATELAWSRTRYTGERMRVAQIELEPGNYTIIFEASKERTIIDNIKLRPGPCINVTSCSTDEFQCLDGSCIDEILACDDEINCPDGSDAMSNSLFVRKQGLFRLVDGSRPEHGNAQIRVEDKWVYVCGLRYSTERICKLLGYSSRISSRSVELTASPLESSEDSCLTSRCSPLTECFSPRYIKCGIRDCPRQELPTLPQLKVLGESIRITDGPSNREGRLEVNYNGTWGTVCDENWNQTATDAACLKLGYRGGGEMIENIKPGTGPIWLQDLNCLIGDNFVCDSPGGIGAHRCDHYMDVHVKCTPGCSENQVVCADGKTCIDPIYVCDGVIDCPGGDDELECPTTCTTEQLACDNYKKCLSIEARCDGINDCQDGSDEFQCVSFSYDGSCFVSLNNESYPICFGEDSERLAKQLCQLVGEETALSWEDGPETDLGVEITRTDNSYQAILSGNKSLVRGCKQLKALCLKRDCGRSQAIFDRRSWNMEWTGFIRAYEIPDNTCPGISVSPSIVLHTNNCLRINPTSQFHTPTLSYYDFSYPRPTCLPSEIPLTEVCYLTSIQKDPQYDIDLLVRVRVQTFNNSECRNRFPQLNISDSTMCVPFSNNQSQLCQGHRTDLLQEGTTLQCKDKYGFWNLVGMFQEIPYGCDREEDGGNVAQFQSILPLVPLIKNKTIEHCEFVCDSDRCIQPPRICDGAYDCLDKADETRVCGINCDFETAGSCGFQLLDWEQLKANPLVIDHTSRSSEGQYLVYSSVTRNNDSVLTSPEFTVNTDSCLEFSFIMPRDEVLLTVVLVDQQTNSTTKILERKQNQGARWRLVQVPLVPGSFQLRFSPSSNQPQPSVYVDDTRVKEGPCQDGVVFCSSDEFDCGNNQCIMLQNSCGGEYNSCANNLTNPKCLEDNFVPSTDIRLVRGRDKTQGRVEIFHDDVWGTICDDSWSNQEARVVCRMLGYEDGFRHLSAKFGRGVGQIWLDDMGCNGSENHLSECDHSGWGIHNCGHSEDAGVDCISDFLRLRDGTSDSNGRVEVFIKGVWGTVCDDNWNNNAARVACRSLGYSGGLATYNVPGGSGPIWLDNIVCDGDEASILHCSGNSVGSHDCSHIEDAGVNCTGEYNPLRFSLTPTQVQRDKNLTSSESVRLVGGNSSREGRLEVFMNGLWGTVCSDRWGDTESATACKTLFQAGGRSANIDSFPLGSGPIWLDEVNCNEDSEDLFSCSSSTYGVHDCTHYQDVVVQCDQCSLSEFMCDENRCLNLTSRCDGVVDCLDNTDELNCTVCPTDWLVFNDSCYYVKTTKKELTFDLAEEECTKLNSKSYLVALETRAEFKFLHNYLKTNGPLYTDVQNGWMTSGVRQNGTFIWQSTGAAIDESVFDWGEGEPGTGKCLSFFKRLDYKMADISCSLYYQQFICEMIP